MAPRRKSVKEVSAESMLARRKKKDRYETLLGAELSRAGDKKKRKSSEWTKRKRKGSVERTVQDLIEIREAVKSIIKIHGCPKGTKVNLAMMGGIAAGGATFDDIVNFKGPRILLDKTLYDTCDAEDVMDAYCGVGLHEVSHLNHTRKLYTRMYNGEISLAKNPKRFLIEGLLEDERIEQKVREESPGYAGYVDTLKFILFDKFEWGAACEAYEKLSDLDKCWAIFFGVIRCPYRLTEDMREFQTVGGTHVFEALRDCMPDEVLDTEEQVEVTSDRIEKLWRKIEAEYTPETKAEAEKEEAEKGEVGDGDGDCADDCTPGEASLGKRTMPVGISVPGEGGTGSSKVEILKSERIDKALRERFEDEMMHSELDRIRREIKSTADRAKPASEVDKLSEAVAEGKTDSLATADEKLKALIKKIEEEFEKRIRFSYIELERMYERSSTVVDPLDLRESIEATKVEGERMEFHEAWESPDGSDGELVRKNIVIHPQAKTQEKSTFKQVLNVVRNDVNAMKQVFQFRLGTRIYRQNERTEGRIDRRRLATAKHNPRVFKRTDTKTDKGIALCLVLDESGSMSRVRDPYEMKTKAEKALGIGVLIAKSLENVPGVELEVYSYGSAGEVDEDNLIKYLYGKKQGNIESMAAYGSGCQNYDHIALKTCGELFVKNTVNKNRMMIVISDGAPAGHLYGGPDAIQATKQAVDALEKQGIYVLNVAIENYASEQMFRHTVKFTNLKTLITDLKKLVTNIIKRTTES